MTTKETVLELRKWQKRAKNRREPLKILSARLKVPLTTLRSIVRRGVRRLEGIVTVKDRLRGVVGAQKKMKVSRAYEGLTPTDKRRVGYRTACRATRPLRIADRARRWRKKRENYVLPSEIEMYDTANSVESSQNLSVSQRFWS